MNLIGQIKFVLYKESERNRWRIQVREHVYIPLYMVYSIILVCSSFRRIVYKQVHTLSIVPVGL